MCNQFIGIDFAGSKNVFMLKLREIMQTPQFCGENAIELKRIHELLQELEDNISYVFEFPYVDRHYRDTFYVYYSAKHDEFYRNCIRIHLFTDFFITKSDDLINLTDDGKEKYKGFFIVRPLPRFPLGRSMISPTAFKKKDILCCLMKSRLSLLGHRLEVYGFPHIVQDTETHTCAESSIWSFLEYLGNRYRQYLPLLPSEILRELSPNSNHRSLPSTGLSIDEVSKFLHNNGCECVIDRASNVDKYDNIVIDKFRLFLLKIYIESGIPVYASLRDNKGHGHAVLIIGHEDKYDHIVSPLADDKVWQDVSDFEKKMVVIDDNQPQYQIGALDSLVNYNKEYKIAHYVVALPKHTNLDAQMAFFLSKKVFNDADVGLEGFGKQWLTRLFLTGSHSFKRFLLERSGLHNNLKKYLALLPFPKFIWVCEIYKIEEFQQKICSGLLIMDATGSNSPASILWYNVGDQRITRNGLGWTGKKPIKPFKMVTYKHNLKGEWSKWKL
jgi:hypothetical protein